MALETRPVFLDDDDPAPPRQRPANEARILPLGQRRAPEWLTRPGDELDAPPDPDAPEAERPGLVIPVLTRPGLPETPVIPAMPVTPATPVLPTTPVEMEPGIERGCGVTWEAAPATAGEPVSAGPAAAEPEETPRPRRPRVSDPSAPWVPAASSVPVPRLKLVEAPAPGVEAEPVGSVPPTTPEMPPVAQDGPGPSPAAPPPLAEPWWIVALDNLRASRRAQAAVAVALASLVLLALWMWPRGVGTTPLSQIRKHPARYDGREVVVRGRVGDDVFSVGNGWAFYLLQGRDTIVAFSLLRSPEPRRVVTVKGQISTGFLDGMPRQALFEGTAPAGK